MNYLAGTCPLNSNSSNKQFLVLFKEGEMLRATRIRVFAYELNLGLDYPIPFLWPQDSDIACVWSLS